MAVSKEHCRYCFDVLSACLSGESTRDVVPRFPDDEYPLFVSWHKDVDGETHLRGCIGNFSGLRLHEGLRKYALISSQNDTRFNPIHKGELPQLTCEVSLLTNFEDAKDYLDWTIGKHGIWIEFTNNYGARRTATFLPQIAKEQGWSKMETLDHLLHKGGHVGKITDPVLESIKLTRYQSDKVSLTYDEYLDLINKEQRQDSKSLDA
ncbi:hypothetical protein EV182_000012 [Spiromyces aspiralis]|uniref:Uncharacterized protein n=1 Tax=Spiromyces aspiralis TaxID=68401 RepID=A0ACC1HXL8_9FUNG|nr:hypothetical protein EV182_000012 [Spiromyces aspiralis]